MFGSSNALVWSINMFILSGGDKCANVWFALPIEAVAASVSTLVIAMADSKKRTWEKRVDDARKRHRPSLKNWSRDGFATTRNPDFIKLRHLERGLNTSIPKIDCSKLSVDDFRKRYEALNLPCILTNIPQHEEWKALQNWTFDSLRRKYSDHMFKCGEDDDGYKIKMKLKYYLSYLENNQDDSPLYIFDSNFYEQEDTKPMMDDFKVPSYFTEDLFSLVGESKRPPYRWFLVGPERSGTTVHIDPLGTSAWNTLISGRKRWVLFPPEVSKRVAKGQDVINKGEDDEAINYFVDLLPRSRQSHPDIQILECIQEPGETIYVPGGWWHGVINLEHTVAITQVEALVGALSFFIKAFALTELLFIVKL